MTKPTALIAGAGIGGLAAAVSLRRAGWNVSVFERVDNPRELGFALILAPNAMAALRQLGLAETIRSSGWIARSGEVRRPDGRALTRVDMATIADRTGEDTVCILRTALHGALLEAAGRDILHLGNAVTGFRQNGDAVTVTLANGDTASGDVLIGADGVGSVIRKALHPNESPARSSGLFAVRGVAFGVAHHLGTLGGAQYLGRGIEMGLGRASQDAVYWYMSIPADLAEPLRQDRVSLAEETSQQFDTAIQSIVAATRPEDMRLDDLLRRQPLSSWGSGLVTLLGDAAHPMLPHAGQGAAQSLEDAAALGRILAPAVPVEPALRRYEALRIPRTTRVINLALRNSRVGSLRGKLSCWLRDTAVRLTPEAMVARSFIDIGRPPR